MEGFQDRPTEILHLKSQESSWCTLLHNTCNHVISLLQTKVVFLFLKCKQSTNCPNFQRFKHLEQNDGTQVYAVAENKRSKYVQVTFKPCFTVGPHPTIWSIISAGLDNTTTCYSGEADSADTCEKNQDSPEEKINIIFIFISLKLFFHLMCIYSSCTRKIHQNPQYELYKKLQLW